MDGQDESKRNMSVNIYDKTKTGKKEEINEIHRLRRSQDGHR